MVAIISVLMILLLMGISLYSFVFHKSYERSYFSYEIFYTLIIVYFSVLIGFGLLYFILSFKGLILIEGGVLQDISGLESFAHSLYFSGVTLMTVGYGDVTPVGWGRLLALTEALIGYLLPAAFFFRIWQHSAESGDEDEKEEKDKREVDYL